MKRALITGAGGPAGVNFALSLKLVPEKLFLVGVDANRHRIHLAPTEKKYVLPKANEENYLDKLNDVIEKEKIEFVHPQPDIEVFAISENRERLDAQTFLPSKKTVRTCQDKFESSKTWLKKGIQVAKTIELKNRIDVNRAFEEFGTPIWVRSRHGAGGRGSTPAYNVETAISWLNYWKAREKDWGFIAQEYLGGRNLAFHSLWKEGELVVSMVRERLEYIYPQLAPSGITGTPSVQKTVHDENVNKVGTEAVLAIDPAFSGIASVDLKERRNGKPCVTEINAGRMFTTSYFFSYASEKLLSNYTANIPYLYLKLAYNEKTPQTPKYNVLPEGVFWVRHIDAPAKLVKDGEVLGAMYT